MSEQYKVKVIEANAGEHSFWTLAGKNVYLILEMMGLDAGGVGAPGGVLCPYLATRPVVGSTLSGSATSLLDEPYD